MRSLSQLFILALVLIWSTGCKRVVHPEPGDLEGIWRVNDSVERSLGPNVPVIAELTIRNLTGHYLSFPEKVDPMIHGGDGTSVGSFERLGKLPEIVPPGESVRATWLLVQVQGTGDYLIETGQSESGDFTRASLHLTSDPAPSLVASWYRGRVAYLKGEGEAELERLLDQLERKPPPPAEVHFLLAELQTSMGHEDFAREQYRQFVELIFGQSGDSEVVLPAWLEERLIDHKKPLVRELTGDEGS